MRRVAREERWMVTPVRRDLQGYPEAFPDERTIPFTMTIPESQCSTGSVGSGVRLRSSTTRLPSERNPSYWIRLSDSVVPRERRRREPARSSHRRALPPTQPAVSRLRFGAEARNRLREKQDGVEETGQTLDDDNGEVRGGRLTSYYNATREYDIRLRVPVRWSSRERERRTR